MNMYLKFQSNVIVRKLGGIEEELNLTCTILLVKLHIKSW